MEDFWNAVQALGEAGFRVVGVIVNPLWRLENFPKPPPIPPDVKRKLLLTMDPNLVSRLEEMGYSESPDVSSYRFVVEERSEPLALTRFVQKENDPPSRN